MQSRSPQERSVEQELTAIHQHTHLQTFAFQEEPNAITEDGDPLEGKMSETPQQYDPEDLQMGKVIAAAEISLAQTVFA